MKIQKKTIARLNRSFNDSRFRTIPTGGGITADPVPPKPKPAPKFIY